MGLSIAQLSRAYRIPVIDYERPAATGVLVSSGCGIMCGVMDEVPALRWCVDIDDLPADHRFADWILWMDRLASAVVLVGWFSLTRPDLFIDAAQHVQRPIITYTPGVELGGRARSCSSLGQLVQVLRGEGQAEKPCFSAESSDSAGVTC